MGNEAHELWHKIMLVSKVPRYKVLVQNIRVTHVPLPVPSASLLWTMNVVNEVATFQTFGGAF